MAIAPKQQRCRGLLLLSVAWVVLILQAAAGDGEDAYVCYHSNDAHDYTALGHAEVVRVVLDTASMEEQFRALARDYFSSFTGPAGTRSRPDPGDIGTAYRSMVGLPGGVRSPLYPIFVEENSAAYRMALKPTAHPATGGDADEFNTVWVYDTAAFPFYDGEVYHQNHCNFFQSEGMPYPDEYTQTVWNAKRVSGAYASTGCPEQPVSSHQRCSTWG